MIPTSTVEESNIWRFVNSLADVLLWETTPEGELTFVSDGIANLFDRSREELLADPGPWNNRVFPGHRARYNRALEIARENRSTTDIEYRVRLPNTGTTWFRDHIMVEPETGHLFGITTEIGDQHDTTERLGFLNKAARLFAGALNPRQLLTELGDLMSGSLANIVIIEATANSEVHVVARTDAGKRLATALESQGPLFFDGREMPSRLRQGRAVLYKTLPQRRLRSLLGPERAELLSRKPPHMGIIAPLMVRRQLLGTVTLLCTDKDREYVARDIELTRDVCSQAAIALDHTRLFEEAAREQEKLSTENEMKDEFLALMSHELRTPLTVIYGVSRILPRILPPLDETSAQFVSDLYSASERTVRLVDDLMLLARLNLGERPELEAVTVKPLLSEIADDFHGQNPERILEVSCDPDADLVAGSPPYIRQVFLNLLSNAQKYTPPEGSLKIAAAAESGNIVFGVADSGPGVGEEELPYLFDRFYRASSSEGVAGSGMGLAICKRLIEALGGQIRAENRKEGGLSVSFSLPAWREH